MIMVTLTLNPFQARVLSRFLVEEVAFIVVGAQAMRAHGFDRLTRDIDILVEASRENAEKLADILPAYVSAVSFLLTADYLAQHNKLVKLPDEYSSEVDVMTSLGEVDFLLAHERRCFALWGSLNLPFLSIEDLYKSKCHSNNPKDQDDAALLAAHLKMM